MFRDRGLCGCLCNVCVDRPLDLQRRSPERLFRTRTQTAVESTGGDEDFSVLDYQDAKEVRVLIARMRAVIARERHRPNDQDSFLMCVFRS